MLTREELKEFCRITGYALGQVEKDYLQHYILSYIGRRSGSSLVFKGGTCLQNIFGLDRFSEDLYFTAIQDFDLKNALEHVGKDIELLGFPIQLRNSRRKGEKNSFRMMIEGPLFIGSEVSRCSITIDMSSRGDIIRGPLTKKLVSIYTEITPYVIYYMNASEIMAEKVRALITRNKARDLYDLYFLIQKKVETDIETIQSKLSVYDIKLKKSDISKAIEDHRKIWTSELSALVSGVIPDFKDVSNIVQKKLSML
jgi:predicted nucleotidyltransferase component of viral defense system